MGAGGCAPPESPLTLTTADNYPKATGQYVGNDSEPVKATGR